MTILFLTLEMQGKLMKIKQCHNRDSKIRLIKCMPNILSGTADGISPQQFFRLAFMLSKTD